MHIKIDSLSDGSFLKYLSDTLNNLFLHFNH